TRASRSAIAAVRDGLRLLQAKQLANQGAIARRAPIVGADPLAANRSLAADDERLGIAGGLIGTLDRVRRVVQDLERDAEMLRERADRILAHVVVDAHGDELEPFVAVRLVQTLEAWDLDLAGAAPRCPNVEQHDLALVIRERLVAILAQHFGA